MNGLIDKIRSAEINKERVAVFLIVVVLIITGGFVYYKNQIAKSQVSQQTLSLTQQKEQENNDLIEKVGKLILLPTNEQPTIATITDKSQLSTQPFFNNAVDGDRVLVYANAKKAILYRPSTNKIIEVAPVNITSPTLTPSPTATPSAVIEQLTP
ncbi:MAG: hypothetical protein A2171_02355 [Candidatus Levybacteria bacterium RBG_13_35_9]|nr:MAG: hypothetical protein A2171_02355 [Candidatus Levybacteria bacterium RBG_13_35_9]